MGNVQKYGSFDLDAMEDEAAELDKGKRPSEFLKMEDGDEKRLRFLPPPSDASWARKKNAQGKTVTSPFKIIHEHFMEIPGQKRKLRFVCPRITNGGQCPACDQADALERTGNSLDKDKARDLRSSARVYANVIDRDDEARGPIIFAFGKGIFKDLKGIMKKFGDFTNPENGYDILIDRKNDNSRISYDVTPDRNASPLEGDNWLEGQYNLDQYANVPTLDEIEEMIENANDGGRGRGRGGNKKTTVKAKPDRQLASGGARSKKRTSADDMEDVVEDAEFEEAEDEEDVPL